MGLREKCPIIEFKVLGDDRGKLIVIEGKQEIPFDIARVFYIYGTNSSVIRGQHANRESEFFLVSIAGNCKVRMTDTYDEYIVELNRPTMGIYIPRMVWKDMFAFSEDAILLVFASKHYDGEEYIRDYEEYTKMMTSSLLFE